MARRFTITCVYKTAPVQQAQSFSVEQVYWLAEQVERFVSIPHDFVCLTDAVIKDVKTRPLWQNLPGWWSKMELFREFDEAFYLDLDTVLVGDISDMIEYPHQFTALRNLHHSKHKEIGSGVMAWSGGHRSLYEAFMRRPHHFMQVYTKPDRWGDQGFIQDHVEKIDRFQDIFPNRIESYKFDVKGDPKPETSIVCFHGKPRPWHVQKPWIPDTMSKREALC